MPAPIGEGIVFQSVNFSLDFSVIGGYYGMLLEVYFY